jgi:hypothetical protein
MSYRLMEEISELVKKDVDNDREIIEDIKKLYSCEDIPERLAYIIFTFWRNYRKILREIIEYSKSSSKFGETCLLCNNKTTQHHPDCPIPKAQNLINDRWKGDF